MSTPVFLNVKKEVQKENKMVRRNKGINQGDRVRERMRKTRGNREKEGEIFHRMDIRRHLCVLTGTSLDVTRDALTYT